MKDGIRIESTVNECWNEIEKFSNEGISEQMKIGYMYVGPDDDDNSSDDGVMTKTNRSEVQTNIDTEETKEYEEENEIYVSKMRTRSKGPLKEYKWVLNRALEHQNKGRPRQEVK